MKGAKMILHSTHSGNLRGSRAASSVWGQALAQENPPCTAAASTSLSIPRIFFRSSQNKPTNATQRELSLQPLDEPSNSGASSSPNIHVSLPSTSSSCSSKEVSCSPQISPPVLLLEGDNYHVSRDGIARTLYRMRLSGDHSSPSRVFSVEEWYDLQNAKKKFVLRHDRPPEINIRNGLHEVVALGEAVQEVNLQEIEAGVLRGAGTGATTWESSIVMAMYFATRPKMLWGDVVELGSGVGLGGILCALPPPIGYLQKEATLIQSLTLTDFNPMVLEQCVKNVENLRHEAVAPMRVSKLDWYDFLQSSFHRNSVPNQLFDTIIACDCAYRPSDITALVATMTSLLRNERSQIHIFGPSNRSGLDKLLNILREDQRLSVSVQPLEMERYRLQAPSNETVRSSLVDPSVSKGLECHFASSSLSRFLHITCSPKRTALHANENLSDID